jgi:hypothetical protein
MRAMFGFWKKREPEMPEDWQFYTRETNGHTESWTTNLALAAIAPIANYSQLICISAPLHDPTPNGQLSSEEEVEIDKWMLPVTDRELLAPYQAIPVAMQTAEGIERAYLYAESLETLQPSIQKVFRDHGSAYKFEVREQSDPAWTVYRDLYPDAEEMTRIEEWRIASVEIDRFKAMSAAVIQSLLDGGDDLTEPRPIDFTVLLPSAEAVERFSNWSRRLDVQKLKVSEPEASGRPFVVYASIELPADFSLIHQRERIFIQVAIRMGGRYDGWGCFARSPRKS